jgi:hypothetical protein
MDDRGQFSTTKKAAMKVAGTVLGHPRAYRAAVESGVAALKVLPHFAIYNRLNAWDATATFRSRQRNLPPMVGRHARARRPHQRRGAPHPRAQEARHELA